MSCGEWYHKVDGRDIETAIVNLYDLASRGGQFEILFRVQGGPKPAYPGEDLVGIDRPSKIPPVDSFMLKRVVLEYKKRSVKE